MSRKHIAQKSKVGREYKKLAKLLNKLYSDYPKNRYCGSHIHKSIFSNQISLSLQNGENTQ